LPGRPSPRPPREAELAPDFAYERLTQFRNIALETRDFSQWTAIRKLAKQSGLKRTLVEREVYLAATVELQEGVE
jgi:hypothetical protein